MASLYNYPADISFREAARQALVQAFELVQSNEPTTYAGCDEKIATPEAVRALHDMRVGTRRFRAALSVFAKALPKSDLRFLEKEMSTMTDALGVVRDLDVLIESQQKLQKTLPENEAYGIERFIVRLAKQRNKDRKILRKALRRWRKERVMERIEGILKNG